MFNNFCKGRVVIIFSFSLLISGSLGAMEDDGSVPKSLVLGNNAPQINQSNTHNAQGAVVNVFNDQQRNYNHLNNPSGVRSLIKLKKRMMS